MTTPAAPDTPDTAGNPMLIASGPYGALKATGKLPSPKGVAFAIIKLLQRDEFPIQDLVQLVQSDPAIAGRLLKFANAAIFGRSRPIVSLQKAIIALGSFRVRDLVLGFSVLHDNRSGLCPTFDYNAFWARSLVTAIACQELSRVAQIASEEHFTVGLLARIGELGLSTLFPARYGELLGEGAGGDITGRERALFGFDHRQLGATMLAEWGLPRILVEATYHHEDPAAARLQPGSRLCTLTLSLDFARALGDLCMAEGGARWNLLPDLLTRSAHLGIGAESLTRLVDHAAAQWRDWGAMLHVRTQDMPPFAELLAASPPRPTAAAPSPAQRNATLLAALPGRETDELLALLAQLGHPAARLDPAEPADLLVAPPPLLLADIDAGEEYLIRLCRKLRATPVGSNTHILVLASPAAGNAALHAIEAGADDVLLKPVDAQNLRLRLSMASRLRVLREDMQRERAGIVRSTEEFADEHRELLQVALTDPLTQLPNRRHGLDYLASEWAIARDNNRPIACLMLDIDHFKRVNDTFGHAAGDAVLRQLAARLKSTARAEDMVFRYGGEEFALILPGAELPTALRVAERIRKLIADTPFRLENSDLPATVSIGLCATQAQGNDADALIRQADAALYQAKEAGRNRVVAAKAA